MGVPQSEPQNGQMDTKVWACCSAAYFPPWLQNNNSIPWRLSDRSSNVAPDGYAMMRVDVAPHVPTASSFSGPRSTHAYA
eukprot:1059372-Pelagomonas_calceolata.AAC.12